MPVAPKRRSVNLLHACILVLVLVMTLLPSRIATAAANRDPTLFIPDVGVRVPDSHPWHGDNASSTMSTALATSLLQRFRTCAETLAMADLRVIIGMARQQTMLGTDEGNSVSLTEVGGALGRQGLLVLGTVSGTAQADSYRVVVYTKNGTQVDSVVETLPPGGAARDVVGTNNRIVASLKDLCAPTWYGTIGYTRNEALMNVDVTRSGDSTTSVSQQGTTTVTSDLRLNSGEVTGTTQATIDRTDVTATQWPMACHDQNGTPRTGTHTSRNSTEMKGSGDTTRNPARVDVDTSAGDSYHLTIALSGVTGQVTTTVESLEEGCDPAQPSQQSFPTPFPIFMGDNLDIEKRMTEGQDELKGEAEPDPPRSNQEGLTVTIKWTWDLRKTTRIQELVRR